jgi:hypothetical protein
MIRPRLPRVASGTRLTTDLVNGIINRAEYAADLLRQHKLVAGTDMYVEPHYDGTRISYLQPVGGGATPSPIERRAFRVVDGLNQIYNPFDDTYTTPEGTIVGDSFQAIRRNVVAGYNTAGIADRGIIYNGQFFTRVTFATDPDPLNLYTRLYGTDGQTAVGEYFSFEPSSFIGSIYGVQCDLLGQKIQDIIYPKETPTGTYRRQAVFLADIYGENIIGEVLLQNTAFNQFNYSFLFNGGFVILDSAVGASPAFRPSKIYKDYIISYDGKIYSISTGSIIKTILYQGLSVEVKGLYENIVSCNLGFTPFTSFLYYIDRDEFEIVNYSGDIG